MRLKKIFFLFVNSYKSAPNQKADVIENNRFLKAPENEMLSKFKYFGNILSMLHEE